MKSNYTDISAAILAGGRSERMGSIDKAFIKIDEKTILRMMWDVISVIFNDIIIITNSNHKRYQEFTNNVKDDLIPGFGPLSGIHAAIKHSKNSHCFVFACDLPFIDKKNIETQCDIITNNHDVFVPKHKQGCEPLHSIWSKSCLPHIEKHIISNKTLKISSFISNLNTYYYETDYNLAFTNINSLQDLENIKIKI
jgi:molybdenum cofactor guanylyltransferase